MFGGLGLDHDNFIYTLLIEICVWDKGKVV